MANIRKISDNSYKITVSCGRDANNKQIRHYMTWKPDRPMTEKQMEKAVQKAAYEFEKQLELGFRPDFNETFNEYAEHFFEVKKTAGMTDRTIFLYRWMLERVSADFGRMKLVDIRPQHINAFYAKIMKPGERKIPGTCYPIMDFTEMVKKAGGVRKLGREISINRHTITALCRGEPLKEHSARKVSEALGVPLDKAFSVEREEKTLSASTVNRYHFFISAVFTLAEKEMIVTFNPAKRTTPPKEIKPKKRSLQPDEIRAIVAALEEEPIRTKAIVYTLLYTGMRRGELCALKWSKVDFEKRQITIDASASYVPHAGTTIGATKTKEPRTVSMPMELYNTLREYWKWYTLERFRLCGAWEDNDFVFCRSLGGLMMPEYVNLLLERLAEDHGLTHLTPHLFRHSCASLMIANGIDVITVSRILGHKKPSMTLDVYSHEIDGAKENAANAMNDIIKSCKTG